nr:hypothetical protein [Alcaligenes faecalis]
MAIFKRDLADYKDIVSYSSISEFIENFTLRSCLLSIKIDGIYFDFLIKMGESKNAFVFFNSAVPEKEIIKTPVFTAQKISSELVSNKIYVSDPFIDISGDMRCFWYLSSKKINSQRIIEDVLRHLFFLMNAERLVFWGSSGGGFPALLYSYKFENSFALVNAPTTTIKEHHKSEEILMSLNKSLQFFYEDRLSGVLDLKELDGINSALILLNKNDGVFLRSHVSPYVLHKSNKELDVNDDFVSNDTIVMIGDWGRGHVVAPIKIIKNIFKYLEYNKFSKEVFFSENRVFSLKNVHGCLTELDQDLVVNVNGVSESAKFAFYVYVDGELKDKIGYQKDNSYKIKRLHKESSYKISYFVRFDADGFIVRGSLGGLGNEGIKT